MVEKVVWLKQPQDQYEEILAFLVESYPIAVAEHFAQKVSDIIDLLRQHPDLGRPDKRGTVRHILIDKRHRLYYRTSKTLLAIVYIFDTRQDPRKNPYQ